MYIHFHCNPTEAYTKRFVVVCFFVFSSSFVRAILHLPHSRPLYSNMQMVERDQYNRVLGIRPGLSYPHVGLQYAVFISTKQFAVVIVV